MNILDVIDQLTEINKKYGNLPCIIEVDIDNCITDVVIGELSVEERKGFFGGNLSVKFLM